MLLTRNSWRRPPLTCWKGNARVILLFEHNPHSWDNANHSQGKEKSCFDRKRQAGTCAHWELSGCLMIVWTTHLFRLENTMMWCVGTRKIGLRSWDVCFSSLTDFGIRHDCPERMRLSSSLPVHDLVGGWGRGIESVLECVWKETAGKAILKLSLFWGPFSHNKQ